jgi:hypothetical protein
MRRVIWTGVLAVICAASAAAGEYHAPRTYSGAPDLQGLWSNSSLTNLERPDDLKALTPPDAEVKAYEKTHIGKPPEDPEDVVGGTAAEWWDWDAGFARIRGQARTSWIVSPADGQRPFSAATKAARKARHAQWLIDFDNPEGRTRDERCISTDAVGPPMQNGGYNDNYQFVQTADHLAIMAEYMHDTRIVRLGATTHPPPAVRLRLGDSIGHWEGETLVIETTNFSAAEVADPAKNPNADMRVVERLTRLGPKEIFYEFTVQNPALYAQTWKGEMVFHPSNGPIYEFACHEGNYAMANMLAGRVAAPNLPPPPPPPPAAKTGGQ